MSRCKLAELLRVVLAFTGGFTLGQAYYYYLLKQIPFPDYLGTVLSLGISGLLGIGNAVAIQLRCISVLTVPMICGKPGRGVLKAVVLTYIVAGPISNMGLNAREVVRVFACSTQLSWNLSMERHSLMRGPLRKAALGVRAEVEAVTNVFRSINEVIEPLQVEIEDRDEVETCRFENDLVDDLFSHRHRSEDIERTYLNSSRPDPVRSYQKKLRYRCENQLSRAVALCIEQFSEAYTRCCGSVLGRADVTLCWPLTLPEICELITSLGRDGLETCDIINQVPYGLEEGYASIKRIKEEFVDKSKRVHLQYKTAAEPRLLDVQEAKNTAELVLHAFEEKAIIMHYVITIMNICMALLFLRIFNAAVTYHDLYLTNIDYDNVYITGYFKRLDTRRRVRRNYVLLPLKKMERNKYIDIRSLSYKATRGKLVSQVLKVMLEVVTATTFVMLDRLFYESLDVVRQYADMSPGQQPTRDLEIEVEGTGLLAVALRKLLDGLGTRDQRYQASNTACLPRPRLMPYAFLFKIYGGYLWILLLLFVNPYTSRIGRTVCSHFYPRREKQRILHLYNDLLKKRMKMHNTLRRKAVQAVRAHNLTGESLLSMRMKFPELLGWLKVLPAARMACLICGEVEPRTEAQVSPQNTWYSCMTTKCPFVCCAECWREAGARCLACDPSLVELSDIDSLTEDEQPAY